MSLSLKISSYSLFSLSHYLNYSSSSFKCCSSITFSNLPRTQGRANAKVLKWVQRSISSSALPGKLNSVSIVDSSGDARVSVSVPQVGGSKHHNRTLSQAVAWKPRSYGTTTNGANASEVHAKKAHATSSKVDDAVLSKFFGGDLLESFSIDNSTYSQSQIRATFYPKFENEKSDREVRSRMIEMVSNGLATMEVSLKHSGSLFMYAGPKGGAYAKNSFGNIYTAVGVFVLGRTFREAWGSQANKKQAEFNEFLERNRMCIAMELVTAVLGDHGQRPLEDYVVVTAVTELGNGKPKFYSTPEIIAFCRKWRLPTNHMWLFSTRKSVTSFFAAFDALCEEGTATTVCQTLDEIADVSVPGSKDHIKVQGEILEGLVARVVNHESTKQIKQVLQDFPLPPGDAAGMNLGPSLRDICAANRSDEKQQIKALLHSVGTSFCPNYLDWFGTEGFEPHSRNAGRSVVSKFLQAHPADFSTKKLQEMIRLMQQKRFPASFKCYYNYQQMNCVSSDNLHFKMAIHVFTDSAFRRYQKELKDKPELWPLYRGFFVDLNLYKSDKEKAADISKSEQDIKSYDNDNVMLVKDGLADEDANMMVKLKLLTYKIRTFLIRNGLSVLFKEGPAAYKDYYQRQMEIWKTSPAKRREMSKMLDEWAVYVRRKYGNKMLSSSVYLSEAEPFLEQYAKRSPQNQALIGCAGNLVRVEDFSAIVDDGRDEEEGLASVRGAEVSPSKVGKDSVTKDQGLVVFFPGIPGCAKSALCKEILKAQGGLGDDRPVHSLMGDLIKARKYWQKIAAERRKKPYSIMLADKNAPNEDVWRQIEDMCRGTKTSAVPVIPDSEGTETNPFSLDALAVFIYRVVQRTNHPGKLDRSSPSAGFVLLMFYHLYEGKSRNTFEAELNERFGTIVKMPLLKSERSPLPQSVKSILEEGISLYKLHTDKHGRLESTKGTYAKEWTQWEKNLRETLSKNAEYLKAIQVPFEYAVQQVLEQLKTVASGEYVSQVVEKRRVGPIVYAAVNLPAADIHQLLHKVAERDPKIQAFFEERNIKDSLTKAHVTLAHKRSHGVATVASYGSLVDAEVPVNMRALVFTERMAALEADPGSVSGEKVTSKNQWPHVTLWTDKGVAAKDANTLQQLFLEGKATRVEIDPPITVTGVLQFF